MRETVRKLIYAALIELADKLRKSGQLSEAVRVEDEADTYR